MDSPTASRSTLRMDAASLAQDLPTLRRLARHLVSDEAEAEDIALDALQAAQGLGSSVRNVKGYAAGIVRFRALRQRRAAARRRHHEAARAAASDGVAPAPDDVAERLELLHIVLEEIQRLPTAQSRAVTLRYLDQLDIRAIAEREEKSASTVRSLLSRGLATVRERLDARFGERTSWSSLFLPWAFASPPPAAPGAEGSVAAAEAAAETPIAAFAGALVTMTTLKTTLIVLPLAALAAWFALPGAKSDGAMRPVDPAPAVRSAPGSVDEALVAEAAPSGRAASNVAPPTDDARPETFPVRGRIVDTSLGPALDVRVELIPLGRNAGLDLESATTDANGEFALDVSMARDEVRIELSDALTGVPLAALEAPEPFPFRGDIVADLPPAIRFVFEGAAVPFEADCMAVVDDHGLRRSAPLRRAAYPWVRFRKGWPTGPTEIRLEVDGGFLLGVAKVPEGPNCFTEPLPALFRECGRVELELQSGLLMVQNVVQLDRIDAPAKPHFPRFSMRDGREIGTSDYVEPGRYRWTYEMGERRITGECDVAALETRRIEVRVGAAGVAQASVTEVLIDASAAPAADLTQWHIGVIDEADPTRSVSPKIEPVEPRDRGLWRVSAEALPAGDWMLFVQSGDGFRATPDLVPLVVGESAGPIVITPATSKSVRVRVVDAESGAPIPGARLWVQEGVAGKPLETSDTGLFGTVELSSDVDVALFAMAEGYGLAKAERDGASPDGELEIRLERGWRSRVFVFDMAAKEFAEGIEVRVDGELRGRTDAEGNLWFDGEGPPERIEVARDQGVEVVFDPFEKGIAHSLPTPGYIFAVRR